MSAVAAAITLGIVAVLVILLALAGLFVRNRQLNPPEFTGDQGFDAEGR